MTGSRCPSHACWARASAATLDAAYGDTGRSGRSSPSGSSSLVTRPYTSALVTASTRSAPAWRLASSTLSVPRALARNVSLGATQLPPTSAAPARW